MSAPNESMIKKLSPEGFEMNKNELEREEGKEESKDAKPKYNKNADFFDSITNSTLEVRRGRGGGERGGYRGGDRGYGGYQRGGF